MAVTIYRSSDASAPTLSGSNGALIAVLDACLVTGYGAKAASGWTKELSGTNLAVYRAPSGNRFRLRVDDTGTTEATIVGYETMSDVNTGTAPFPTAAQQSGGLYVRKSEVANTNARGWVVAATATAFYFLPQSNNADWLVDPTYQYISGQMFFGDINSFKIGDAYGTLIQAAISSSSGNGKLGANSVPASTLTPLAGHYLCRAYDGTGGSKACGKRGLYDVVGTTPFGSTSYPAFPCVVTGDMLVSPIVVTEADVGNRPIQRGVLPGMWDIMHSSPAQHGDTINGTGTLAGKSFQLFTTSDTSTAGRALMETSDTW